MTLAAKTPMLNNLRNKIVSNKTHGSSSPVKTRIEAMGLRSAAPCKRSRLWSDQ